ncbi:hypothetical protein [Thermus tengchongensis]|uniref:hypothetical protein n=1 Tax=Thermus tengchongensis TaxID=1214928 RepID=UPI001F252004|nr:hypothetical protein [Thermus tengchongensis]
MMPTARYEKALQLALRRMGVQGVVHVDGVKAVSTLFDLCEEGRFGEQGVAQVRDVYRLVNTIEDLERQAGIQHVRVRSTAKGKEKEALARLEALGYEVRIYPDIGPRDGEVSWIAVAFYEGHGVAYGFGDTREDALRDLVGEVGA